MMAIMKMMIRLAVLLPLVFLLSAEDKKIPADAAPPEVTQALRARVEQFYQAHVDGKYRLADQVVAEESKDVFFAMAKPKYLGFEIVRINYLSEKFTLAEAVVSCKSTWFLRGENLPINMPGTSQWKLIDGQWYVYFPPVTERQTPFGMMHSGPGNVDPKAGGSVLPADPKVLAQRILEAVRADKNELILRGYEPSSGEVRVTNGMQGPIRLAVDLGGGFAGLSYSLDKAEIKAGEVGVVKFVVDPKDKSPKPVLDAKISVEPTNQVLPVRLVFALPPEVQRLMPKGVQPKP
jgi:hypothetical protein